jgi:hypothetical protein
LGEKRIVGLAKRLQQLFFEPDRLGGHGGEPPLGERDALAEVAGRDSVAAAVAFARRGEISRVLPTIAYTGTEYGEPDVLLSNLGRLHSLLEPMGVEVLEPAIVGSPRWWNEMIGRVNSVLTQRYGPWHICVGCHMYLHATRVPLAWATGATRLIAGERLGHGGKVKINQTKAAVAAYRKALGEWGISLEMPILEVDDEEAIIDLVGEWREGDLQPACVLSGNYRDLEGHADYDSEKLRAYLEEYAIPVTSHILAELRERGKAEYGAIVRGFLK